MNEFSCLGAELRVDKDGEYCIKTHTDEAEEALEVETQYRHFNPYNGIMMIDLWLNVVERIARRRAARKMEAEGRDEIIGCNRPEELRCLKCREKGLDSFEGGCIFYDKDGKRQKMRCEE